MTTLSRDVLCLSRMPVCCERHQADVTQRGLASAIVVEPQPFANLIHSLALGGEPRAIQPPHFQGPQARSVGAQSQPMPLQLMDDSLPWLTSPSWSE